MVDRTRFESAEAARTFAVSAAATGRFDLFRGQSRDWPVTSTFRRLAPEDREPAFARLNEFIQWAKREPALSRYGLNSDQAIAIAQHYGIPTTFIDFTTSVDVAMSFALASPGDGPAEHDGDACIVAFDSGALRRWVAERFVKDGAFDGPVIVSVDVTNLWRLEAQAGCFLVDDDLLDDFPFAQICFPRDEVAPLGHDALYPVERSDLELILDQWFQHRRASDASKQLREEIQAAVPGTVVVGSSRAEPGREGIGLKAVRRPPDHPSWTQRSDQWRRADETYPEAMRLDGAPVAVSLPLETDLVAFRADVQAQLRAYDLHARRGRSASWIIDIAGTPMDELARAVERQWDALRIDGYSSDQVEASIAASIVLAALQEGLVPGHALYPGRLGIGQELGSFAACYGGDLLVEFCGMVGYARGVVSAEDLRRAVREDIDDFIPTDFYDGKRGQAECMGYLLLGIHRPQLLFDFDRLADVYARQVIPSAVVSRPDYPLFPVRDLTTFGVP